ncbi:hypothetical protein HOD88_03130 [archaeon]|nr:hypothetical protein [archaeon]
MKALILERGMRQTMNNQGKIAISEIMILLISLFAITWMIGGVYGEEEDDYLNAMYKYVSGEGPSPGINAPLSFSEKYGMGFPMDTSQRALMKLRIEMNNPGIQDSLSGSLIDVNPATPAPVYQQTLVDTADFETTSVSDYLDSIEEDSSFAARKELATSRGIKEYTGTAEQNTDLLNKLKEERKLVIKNDASVDPPAATTIPADGLFRGEGFTYDKINYRSFEKLENGDIKLTTVKGESTLVSAEEAKEVGLTNSEGEMIGKNIQPGGILSGVKAVGGVILTNGLMALSIYGISNWIGNAIFPEAGKEVQAFSGSLSAGVFAGKTSLDLFGNGGVFSGRGGIFGRAVRGKFLGVGGGIWIGAAAAITYFALTYDKEKQEAVIFTCYPWDAPERGENCGLCNEQGLPCSEYQCKSLGQSCSIVNPGTSEEKCVWVNRNDNEFPIIEAWDDALLEGYRYTPDNAVSPPDRGVTVVNDATDGCVKAFTPLKIGITLDEPAKCKIDPERKASFDEMRIFLSGSLLQETHEFQLSLPGSANLGAENITLENDGQYELYVRCADANDNSNLANFVFKYCVEEGPDTTAPLIVSTSIINEMPIKFDQTNVEDFELYLNEPSECKWSHLDLTYENMEETFENCDRSIGEINGQMLYSCKTTLTGLQNRMENKFYFRCRDQPIGVVEDKRNTNAESYKFTLIGTRPLYIGDFQPNGTDVIRDSANSVKVEFTMETKEGFNEGEATCYYSETDSNYIEFFNTNSYEHSQEVYLEEGNYHYFLKCVDLGGNEDKREIDFYVESDKEAPVVVRAYNEDNKLKLITNEESECSYSTNDCSISFEEMNPMTTSDNLEHFTPWNTQSDLFIKCRDEYYNLPVGGNQCNMIVRATDVGIDL